MKKKFFILSCVILSQSALALAAPPAPADPRATLSCRVVETQGDVSKNDYKQWSYILTANVEDTDMNSQIIGDSKYVKGIHIDIFGCKSCATTNEVREPEINATLTDATTGAKAEAVHGNFGTGMLAVGDRTVAYVCNILDK